MSVKTRIAVKALIPYAPRAVIGLSITNEKVDKPFSIEKTFVRPMRLAMALDL
jgi:hypothetical protein